MKKFFSKDHLSLLGYILRWILPSLAVGGLVGSATALFLYTLSLAGSLRDENTWMIALLPIGGLLITYVYNKWGDRAVKGNNLLIEEFHSPRRIIPFKMATMVYFGTIVTHLFGGSAGREGTAVQIGGAIADQFSRIFKLKPRDRKILIVMGVSAGFSAVFGTPLAGAVFALEVMFIGKMRYEAIYPSFIAAVISNYICLQWGITHSVFNIVGVPEIDLITLLWAILAGVLFGLISYCFSKSVKLWSKAFSRVSNPIYRPVIGGAFIAAVFLLSGQFRYAGLGVEYIEKAFLEPLPAYDFIGKLFFSTLTLGCGFKGGEVTPLFFVGATLGNALSGFIDLPTSLLAGMGLVAVLAGATNTPIACILMGLELYGVESGIYIAIACVVAYIMSGRSGIYGSQLVSHTKNPAFIRDSRKRLNEL